METVIKARAVIKDFLVLALVSTIPFTAIYAQAETKKEEQPFINFTDPLSLSRGQLNPINPDSLIYPDSVACEMVKNDWGWSSCVGMEKLIYSHIVGIGSTVVITPDSQGYVSFDDWNDNDKDSEIEDIWDALVEDTKEQSKRAGVDIRPIRWVVYPTLNSDNKYLYYAFKVRWGDDEFINIKVSLFDRKGYVPLMIILEDPNASEEEIRSFVEQSALSYTPSEYTSYSSFTSGDKIAAVGVIGTLAALVGVKYGKGFFAAALAFALIALKKLWFIIFLPLIYIGRLFKKKDK